MLASGVGILRHAVLWSAILLGGCAFLRPEVPREPSHAITPPAQTALGRMFQDQAARHPGQSGFRVLATGRSAFAARAELADAAERSLDLQYYSAPDDLSSALLLRGVAAASARGVRVRILLDDIYPPTRVFARRAMALHPAIQVRLFNPFFFGGTSNLGRIVEFALDAERLNRRMHNKLWLTDNAAAIFGSRNLGDEYFGLDTSSNFADVELLAVGPIVGELSTAFDAYWNSAAAVPLEAVVTESGRLEPAAVRRHLEHAAAQCNGLVPCDWLKAPGPLADLRTGREALLWGAAQLVWDPPDLDKSAPRTGIEHGSIDDHPGGTRTQAELLIASPYFIPSTDGRDHLAQMRERGVRVAVLTNSLASTDSPAAHAGYAAHRGALLRAGIELYEIRPQPGAPHKVSHRWGHASPASLHAKLIVHDRRRAIVGSFNQDPRSRLHNTEAWVTIDNAELAADLAVLFDEGTLLEHSFKVELHDAHGSSALRWTTEEAGTVVHFDAEPTAGIGLRLWRAILGVLVPEHLL